MGCGGAKSVSTDQTPNNAVGNRGAGNAASNRPKIQPPNKFEKLADPVLKAFSDIFGAFAQIDPHRKKPVPKMA